MNKTTPIQWPHNLPSHPKASIFSIVLTLLILSTALACTSTPDQETQPHDPAPAQPAITPYTPSQALTKEQIDQRTIYYLAVSTWADIIHSTYSPHHPNQPIPHTHPQDPPQDPPYPPIPDTNFHHAMMSQPHTKCANDFQKNRKTLPYPPVEELFLCTANMIASSDASGWNTASDLEKEARARQHLSYLWQSINPIVLIATKFAAQRGIDFNPIDNPDFADLASKYQPCAPTDADVNALAQAPTPTQMAKEWSQIQQTLSNCVDNVTNTIFPKETQTPDATRQHRHP